MWPITIGRGVYNTQINLQSISNMVYHLNGQHKSDSVDKLRMIELTVMTEPLLATDGRCWAAFVALEATCWPGMTRLLRVPGPSKA